MAIPANQQAQQVQLMLAPGNVMLGDVDLEEEPSEMIFWSADTDGRVPNAPSRRVKQLAIAQLLLLVLIIVAFCIYFVIGMSAFLILWLCPPALPLLGLASFTLRNIFLPSLSRLRRALNYVAWVVQAVLHAGAAVTLFLAALAWLFFEGWLTTVPAWIAILLELVMTTICSYCAAQHSPCACC